MILEASVSAENCHLHLGLLKFVAIMSEPVATSASLSTTDEHVCRRCRKHQSELPNPLKRCAKCQSVNYCSRACQQAHWSNHKKACRAKAAQRDQSLNNPTKEKILQEAKQTHDLLR